MRPRYTFIIPLYNAQSTLNQCVQSLLDQIRDNEILLIDDGSIDDSPGLCDELAKKHPLIRVIHTENGGVSRARNLGIAQALGQWIIFFDADDYWKPNVFDDLDRWIQSQPKLDAAMFDYAVLDVQSGQLLELDSDRGLNLPHPVDGSSFLSAALAQDPHYRVSVCRWVVSKALIDQNALWFKEDLYFEDMLWVFQMILAASSVTYYPHSLYVYRQNQASSITGSLNTKKLQDRIWISAYWLKEAPLRLMDPRLRNRLLKRTSELAYTTLIRFKAISTAQEARLILRALKDNASFLDYPNSRLDKVISIMAKIFGISFTSVLLNQLYKIKNGAR